MSRAVSAHQVHQGIHSASLAMQRQSESSLHNYGPYRRLVPQAWTPLPWNTPYLRTVTFLEIGRAELGSLGPISVAECLDMLHHAPQLQHLVLNEIFDVSEASNRTQAPAVALDHLCRLVVRCAIPGLILLLRGLQLSVHCTVEIGFQLPVRDSRLPELLPLLAPFSGEGEPYGLCYVLAITASRSADPQSFRVAWAAHDARRGKVRIVYDAPADAWQRALWRICAALRTDLIVRLSLGGDALDLLGRRRLPSILRQVPVLHGLVLGGLGTIHAIELLQRPMDTRRGSGVTVLPGLRRVEVRGVSLVGEYGAELLEAVRARRELGAPIDEVALLGCCFNPGFLQQLQEYVALVNCDI